MAWVDASSDATPRTGRGRNAAGRRGSLPFPSAGRSGRLSIGMVDGALQGLNKAETAAATTRK
jgi:hypothetical protein